MKRYIPLLSILFATAAIMAQETNDTINRMVLVESTYNPIIAGAVKRNFTPEEVKPSMNKEAIVYANEGVPLTQFKREAQAAQAVAIVTEKGTPGYAHIGYGNYYNLSGMAAYKFCFNESNDLALKAHVDGWNGKFRLGDDTKWSSRLYDMGIDADYNTRLGGVALNTGIHAAYYNYNYLTYSIPTPGTDVQSAHNLGAYIGIKGSAKNAYYYQANVSYAHYGRSTHFASKTPHSEEHLHVDASLDRDLYDWGMAKLLVRSDLLTYHGINGYHNNYSLTITPRWDYQHGNFLFVSGFNLDILTGKNINHPVQASPECSISYIPEGNFTAKLTLNGGRDINTFSQLYALSPYWASKEQIRPTYTFMNAHLEGNLRIVEGLHLHFGGGYKILSDALFETAMDSVGTTYTGITNHNAQVATIDAAISYSHKDFLTLSAKGTYNYWMLQGNQALLARAPQLMVDLDARVRIIPKLYAYTNLQFISFTSTKVAAHEQAIIDWSLGAHYSLNKRFTVFLDGNNLLNHRHQYFTGYPSQGFNVLAGVMVKF